MSRLRIGWTARRFELFWAALQRGAFISDAAEQIGSYRKQGSRWVTACGGVRPRRGRDLKGRCLTFAEREEIALATAGGETIGSIARRLGRAPSTISRELGRNADRRDGRYRASTAHALAYGRASRPKPAKLAVNAAAARACAGRSAQALLPRADRGAFAPPVPRGPGDVGVDPDDLPIAVRAIAGRAAPRVDCLLAYRPLAA
jgi:transposase-like protein